MKLGKTNRLHFFNNYQQIINKLLIFSEINKRNQLEMTNLFPSKLV